MRAGVAAHELGIHTEHPLGHARRNHQPLPDPRPRGSSGLLSPQLTAFFTSAPILASSAAVNSIRAKAVGHMAPSSRFASSLKPNVAYLVFELLRALEEADDLAVLGIRGHPVPESRLEGWRAGFDDRMEPLAQSAIRFRHFGDLREHGAFPVRLGRARASASGRLQLLGALVHRASFLVRESLKLLAVRGCALGGLIRVLHYGFLPYES
jgi:hypothetical protein